MLTCASSVTNHTKPQIVERTSQTHSVISSRATFLVCQISMSSVINHWTNARQHEIYLLNIWWHTGNVFLYTSAFFPFTPLALLRFSSTLLPVLRGGWVGAGAGAGFPALTTGLVTFTILWPIAPTTINWEGTVIRQSINQSINQSIDQSINQSINQSMCQSVSQSISRPFLSSLVPLFQNKSSRKTFHV